MTTRNLQITIFEAPPEAQRTRTGGARGGPGTDPGENYVKPPPDDPGENYVKPPPDDPGENYVKPPPDDTSGGADLGGAHVAPPPQVVARYLPTEVPATGSCCASACTCREPGAPEHPCISPGDHSGFVIVRLAAGVGPINVDSLWQLAEASGLEGLRAVLAAPLLDEAAASEASGSSAGERRGGHVAALRRWLGKEGPHEEGETERLEPEGALVSRPLVQLHCRDRDEAVHAIEGVEAIAALTGFRPRHSLACYWRVDLRAFPDLVADVVDRLNELAEVDLAYRELRAIDTAHGDDPITGGELGGDQAYFDPAPVGIGAGWLREYLKDALDEAKPTPDKIRVIDLEQGWTTDHLELASALGSNPWVYGENRQDDEPGAGNHGTAVLGQLAAAGVGPLGVQGSATDVATFRLASHYRRRLEEKEPPTLENPFPGTNGHVASAIVNCLIGASPLHLGDVLLLEVQRGRLPTETDEADFDAIRLATALGVVVVEAAGNGNHDLDRCGDPQTGRSLQRGASGFVDSGAILVGASFSELPHDRAPFSNYGSRLDCYGWGEGVTTCGYGDLHGGGNRNEYYTNTFNGTSSAAPIIAGAAVLLQALHALRTRSRLLPLPMRALLSSRATGTPQGPNVGGHIRVMPDLRAIVGSALQLVPDLYVRRSPCDDGSPLGPGDEISSSPDVLVFKKIPNPPTPPLDLGETSSSAHHPAPGETRIGPGKLHVYVRLRNRGCASASVEVQLYAAPTATLIGPEDWQPISSTLFGPKGWPVDDSNPPVGPVPPGDTLWPSAPVAWKPPAFPEPELLVPDPSHQIQAWPTSALRAYSYLAVFDPDGEAAPDPIRALPPGGRYFDWRCYREFLRGPGVAWRNVHPIGTGSEAEVVFFLAGTPDRTREFDLEVIQRLPEGATVRLFLPRALASALHQRQPGLAFELSPGSAHLTLPRRRSTRFSRVQLPCGLRAPAGFIVATDADPKHELTEGHSLAIRQLWRGEEVGRITWYVTA